MEEQNQYEEERIGEQAKTWVQENLRVIVSIFIVAAIALGIYSYSQRSEDSLKTASTTAETSLLDSEADSTTNSVAPATDNQKNTVATPVETSQETATAFVEKAARGEGSTHLARRALMNYLEKNPDSGLTGAHKVYIEDYLRKQAASKKHLAIGQSLEFSKDSIRQAIEHSKSLSNGQLKNLGKYAQRVSAYRS